MVDCADSACCSHPSCASSLMCVFLSEPSEVLLRKSPPPPSASFHSRTRFIYEGEEPVQSYAKGEAIDRRRVAVLRGRALTEAGDGIIGARVSVASPQQDAANYGFTLTRPGGW